MASLDLPWDVAQSANHAPDFRALVGDAAWLRLPAAVRARFTDHRPRTYPGAMDCRASGLGWLIAQACRLIGTPLAPWRGEAVPMDVRVWQDADGALVWDRTYRFAGRAPIEVSSRKLMAGPALLEIARGGLGMRLTAGVRDGALVFVSTGYILRLGSVLLPIPGWLTPGRAEVIHRDLGGGAFRFSMRFVHPFAGETIFQSGDFRDPPQGDRP